MSRQCAYCDRWFRSKQSVRSHLKWCEPWKEAKAAGYKPHWVMVDVFKCRVCWNGCVAGGHAATGWDVQKHGGVCPTCKVPADWIKVGQRAMTKDQAHEVQMAPATF
jgi:hypothetical protein